MPEKRKVEIFSAGCPACEDLVNLVQSLACPSCEVRVRDMNDSKVASRAKDLGIRSVPVVVVDGQLVGCCQDRGPDEAAFKATGIGQPP